MFTQSVCDLELDLTNLCNARCPQCPRYDINYKLRPGLNKNNLSLELIQNQIDYKYLEMAERFHFIGTTGEPTLNPQFLDIQKFLLDINPGAKLICHTNGDTHNEDWWAECGQVYSTSPNSVVQFGIDGLEDTHHLYRVNTKFERVMKHAKAFIDNGGQAVWQFLIFKHNQHQVYDAMEMSRQLGFARFKPLRSTRFIYHNDTQPKTLPHKLEPATMVGNIEAPPSMKTGLDAEPCVQCKSMKDKYVYIYPDGTVWPCTWLAGLHLWGKDPHNAINWSMIQREIVKPYGPLPNINTQKLSDILASEQWNAWQFVNRRPTLMCIQQCNINQPTTEDKMFGPSYGDTIES